VRGKTGFTSRGEGGVGPVKLVPGRKNDGL